MGRDMTAEAHGDQGNLQAEGRSADPWDIIPRNFHFNIRANRKRHWLGDDVVKTVLIDNLSIFLPEGERFFIRSLKHYIRASGGQGSRGGDQRLCRAGGVPHA